MGRIKPKAHLRRPVKGDAPPAKISASGVVGELMAPFLPRLVGPEDQQRMQSLATIAATAWTVSRMENAADLVALSEVAEAWKSLERTAPAMSEIADRMLHQARQLHPTESWVILSARVEFTAAHFHIRATFAREIPRTPVARPRR